VKEEIVDCIYAAVDESNLEREGEEPMAKSPDTPIHGSGSTLDSLGLINFVVAVEENVEREFGVSIMLADDRALAQEPSPFDSIGALAAYVELLLQEQE
jgi:acyl carrier protein